MDIDVSKVEATIHASNLFPHPTETPIVSILTPKGLGLPYVGFIDFGQAAVNAFYF
jgi:hypothetical protein